MGSATHLHTDSRAISQNKEANKIKKPDRKVQRTIEKMAVEI
jgi:hypothetical protein